MTGGKPVTYKIPVLFQGQMQISGKRSTLGGLNGRAGEIRTHDLLHPMQARYQATLQPETEEGPKSGMQPRLASAFFKNHRTILNFASGGVTC
jgi:hypothetical protein